MADLVTTLAADAWQRCSGGDGTQGPRLYDWVAVSLRPALQPGWVHRALLRRHPERPTEIASYLVYTPTDIPLEELARVAGRRWTIESTFKLAKGQVGLDQDEVRSYQGWYRHITLALLALAVFASGVAKRGAPGAPGTSPSPSPNSVGCWSASRDHRPLAPPRSSPGRAGAGITSEWPSTATASAV